MVLLEPSEHFGEIGITTISLPQKLDELQSELKCPNEFIYDFIKDIQKEWDPNSFKLKAQKLQKK